MNIVSKTRRVLAAILLVYAATESNSAFCGTPKPEEDAANRLQQDFQQAYNGKDWDKAIELGQEIAKLAPRGGVSAYNLACVYSINGQPEEAVRWLTEAGTSGFKRLELFTSDSDLENVRTHPGYERALAIVRENHEKALAELRTLFEATVIRVFTPPDLDKNRPSPLIIALHGYGGDAYGIASQWQKVAAEVGAILVAPQAVRPGPGVGYSWTGEDHMSADEAEQLVRWTFEFAMRKYNIDKERVVLTGFSQGGFVALAVGPRQPCAFTGVIPMAGGYLRNLDAPPKATGDHPPRFYFMVGERDRPVEELRQAAADFAAAGYAARLRIYPKVGHTFPLDHDRELREALDFVLRR